MTDPAVLNIIKEYLSRTPLAASRQPGWPDNAKAIRFPRSAVDVRGRLEIRYEIVEDDQTVWLQRILPVD